MISPLGNVVTHHRTDLAASEKRTAPSCAARGGLQIARLADTREAQLLARENEDRAVAKKVAELATRRGRQSLGRAGEVAKSHQRALRAVSEGVPRDVRRIGRARHVFRLFDEAGDGAIDVADLAPLLRAVGVPCSDAEVLVIGASMDADGSGSIDWAEVMLEMTWRIRIASLTR